MKIKNQEIIPNHENPFAECKLDREPCARVLTDIVKTYADGFVLAINNEWGTGKTTFVKMWQQYLKKNEFQTVYFNAWENDFDNNPLVAIMSELETLTNTDNKKVFKSVLEKGAVLVKNIAPAIVKSLIKKYAFDVNEISIDTIENATKASTEILEEEIKTYTSKKKTIVEFRNELKSFVEQTVNLKPLVFIIDELDRCRPNYAVEVLEQVKHFFSVSGIVFVLSIDKEHLSSAIKGYYGTNEINTNEYLRRFIDLEYSIPKPPISNFVVYLFNYYDFKKFTNGNERRSIREFKNDGDNLIAVAELLFQISNATLRQQHQIFALTRLILLQFQSNQYFFPELLFILVYLKTLKKNHYQTIESNSLTLQELSDLFADLTTPNNSFISEQNLIMVEALLLTFYNNNSSYAKTEDLFYKDDAGNYKSTIVSRVEKRQKHTSLIHCLEYIIQSHRMGDVSLSYLIDRINLLQPLQVT